MSQKTGKLAADYLMVLVAVFFWGLSLIWTDEIIDQQVPVFIFVFLRMCIAGSIMLVVSLCLGKLQKIQKGDLKWFLALVFFEPFLYFIGESYGLQLTDSPTLTAIILAVIPVFVMIFGQIFYRENLSAINKAGVFITLAGVITYIAMGGDIHAKYLSGIAVMVLALIGSAGYSLVCKKLTAKYSPITITTYQFSLAIPFFAVTFLIFGLPQWHPGIISFSVLKPILYLAVLCSCLCFGLYTNAIEKIGMTKASVFSAVIPVVSGVFAYILGRDVLTPWHFVAMIITLTGVVLSQKK